MGLISAIQNLIYPHVEEKWQQISCHGNAIALYIIHARNFHENVLYSYGYKNPVDRFVKYERADIYISKKDAKLKYREIIENAPFRLKKFIVEHENIILEAYERETKYRTVKELLKDYKYGVTSVCEKHMPFRLLGGEELPKEKSFSTHSLLNEYNMSLLSLEPDILSFDYHTIEDNDRLAKSDVNKVLSKINGVVYYKSLFVFFEKLYPYADEIRAEDARIKEIIRVDKINRKFDKTVLSDKSKPLRGKYVCDFLKVRKSIDSLDLSQKEKVVNDLKELDEYISKYLKQEYERIDSLYHDGLSEFEAMNADSDFGDNLQGDDLYDSCIQREEYIKKIQAIHDAYKKLYEKYPNGIKGYEDSHITVDDNLCRTWKPSKEDIINLGEQKLAELENKSELVGLGKEWIDNQKQFASQVRTNYKEYISNWGCYFYDLSVETPSFRDKPTINNFRIWQFFGDSYCDDTTLDYTLVPRCKENSVKNSLFASNRVSYKDSYFEKVLSFLRFIKEQKGNTYIVFGNSNRDFYSTINSKQFSYLRKRLSEEGISYFESLQDVEILDGGCVVLFELITSNDNLRKQSYEIINKLNDKHPVVCYISMRKGYDKQEMSDIIKDKEKQKEKEEQERQKKIREEREKADKINRAKNIADNYIDAFNKFFPNVSKQALSLEDAEAIIESETKLSEYRDFIHRIHDAVSGWDSIKGIPYYHFYHYYPTRFEDVTVESQRVRSLIYNFKDGIGMSYNTVAKIMASKLQSTFSAEDLLSLTLVCIPASTIVDNNDRYTKFSTKLCNDTGMRNGFSHITITKEKSQSHLGGTDSAEYAYDKDFFKDAKVILFDDVVTRGRSMTQMKNALEGLGATIVCAMSIGRTFSDYYGDNRQPHPWSGTF